MGLTVLEVVLGALVSILVTILIEVQRKPRLEIQIAPHADRVYEGRPAKLARFLYLRLVNRSLPRLFSWMTREIALECHGWISFQYPDGRDVFGRSMPIRWSGTPEPAPISVVVGGREIAIFDPSRLTLESRVDVPVGEHETFDVAARFDNEEQCYGWSNASYFSDPVWRNPDWALPVGCFLVKATVVSAGQRVTRLFRLINDEGQGGFHLEQV